MANYQIFSDSCCDLSTLVRKENNISYVHMGIVVDGEEKIADLDWMDYKPEEFYGWLSSGKKVKTTQVSVEEFLTSFRPYLEKGIDIIYIACSTALTGSLNVFLSIVKPQLEEEFPDRKIIGIDSLIACVGLGMLCLDAAKKRDEGLSIEELAQWVEDHKFFYNQFATVETLKYLKEAGRVKGAAAFFGDIFGVKPIFISDRKGNNFVINKVKGTKASIEALVEGTKKVIHQNECNKIFIGQGMNQKVADVLKKRFEDELGCEVYISWIGPIVGTSCGPGVIGVYCYGDEVTRYEGDGIE